MITMPQHLRDKIEAAFTEKHCEPKLAANCAWDLYRDGAEALAKVRGEG